MIPIPAKTALLALLLAAPVALTVAAAPFPMSHPVPLLSGHDASLTETYCDHRTTVTETLRHDFAEAPQLAALTGTGMTMELWASDLLGSWTMVHHGQDGISCIVTSGMDWSVDKNAVTMMDQVLAQTVHQS